MKKGLALLIFSISVCSIVKAQSEKFGDVSIDELKISPPQSDTGAVALTIFDRGKVTIDPNLGTFITRHTRIKIFKRAGFSLANVQIVGNGVIKKISAATFNLEHGEIKRSDLPDELLFKTRYNKTNSMKAFALPDIKEGSVIDYEYTLADHEHLRLPNWPFQDTIPAITKELEILSGDKLNFTYHLTGDLPPPEHVTKYNGKYHKWTMRNIPGFKIEPQMPDLEVYLSILLLSTIKSWETVQQNLISNYDCGGVAYDKKARWFEKELNDISALSNDEAKIKAIVNLIKSKIEWNGRDDFLADPVDEIISRKSGTVGDINLILANLLVRAGLDVSLLFISTKRHGLVLRDLPTQWQFNYLACRVKLSDGKEMIVDATEKSLPVNELPRRCYNLIAFSIKPTEYGWIEIKPSREKTFVTGSFKLDEKGELSGAIQYSSFEYAAFMARKMHEKFSGQELNKEMLDEKSWIVKNINSLNLNDPEKPLQEDYEIVIPDFGNTTEDLIYFNPILFFKIHANPFTQESRIYPIDLGLPEEKTMMISILIPENYIVEELPKNQTFALPNSDAKFIYNISANEKTIQITTKFQLTKTMFFVNEYSALKEFYNHLVAKQGETIVLKKKQ